jgi:hypothetical protein
LGFTYWGYFTTPAGVLVKLYPNVIERESKKRPWWFFNNLQFAKMGDEEKLELVLAALDAMASSTPSGCRRFILGTVTGTNAPLGDRDRIQAFVAKKLRSPKSLVSSRSRLNEKVKEYCLTKGTFEFVDVEALVPPSEQLDENHFTRRGYINIGNAIRASLQCRDAVRNVA